MKAKEKLTLSPSPASAFLKSINNLSTNPDANNLLTKSFSNIFLNTSIALFLLKHH